MMIIVFFFNDTATTEIYTLSLHDALPIYFQRLELGDLLRVLAVVGQVVVAQRDALDWRDETGPEHQHRDQPGDRKSTRLNSSHANISYAVFCLQKKTKYNSIPLHTIDITT